MGNGVLGIESGAVNPAATDNISPTAPTGFCGFGGAHTGEALARKAPRSGRYEPLKTKEQAQSELRLLCSNNETVNVRPRGAR
jgi:hypothetical protein